MKKLGIVGGTGPESTVIYYHDINSLYNERHGGSEFPELILDSINLYKALDYCKYEKYDELVDYLMSSINNLARAGAEFAALSANTMHIVFDKLVEKSPIPLVSIVDAARDEALRRDYHKIGLLGTIFTMTGDFFKKPFEDAGIQILTPSGENAVTVNGIIANELELGIVKEESRAILIETIAKMKSENGIEAVVLGCTELPLALSDENSPVPCLDTMQIHIKTLVDMI